MKIVSKTTLFETKYQSSKMIVSVSERTNEIELAGKAKELDFLSKQLLIDNTVITLEYEGLNPFPYSKFLEAIRIKHSSNEAVKISVDGNSLLIEGSSDNLRFLSESIQKKETKLKNNYIHIEYSNGHFYLSQDSIPLVVSFQ